MESWSLAVDVRSVSKRYGNTNALNDVSLTVSAGEVVALLGPNGAGKTTLLEIVEGLRAPTSGHAKVLGEDVHDLSKAARTSWGVQVQNAKSYRHIKAGEFLDLFVAAYGGKVHSSDLLRLVGLSSKSNDMLSHLSAGQHQRISFAAALAGNPKLLILDEPTSNLDPQSRRLIWKEIKRRSAEGTAVLFATHQIDEAEQFCDRVVIIDHGHVLARGATSELISTHCPGYDILVDVGRSDVAECTRILGIDPPPVDRDQIVKMRWATDSLDGTLDTIRDLAASGVKIFGLSLKKHSLEDVFIKLTGESPRE